jgi:ATPase subunit of ABC transporter with duplicated ATPase domains
MISMQVDAGQIRVAPKVEVGYLAQTAVSGSQRTVWEEARSQMTRLIRWVASSCGAR